MGIWKKVAGKGSKALDRKPWRHSKSKASGGPIGRPSKSKVNNNLSEADQSLFGGDFKKPISAADRKLTMDTEMSIWDLDGGFSKKQWAVGGAAAAGGAGYLGMGHQGKNKKKDDTLKFLGY